MIELSILYRFCTIQLYKMVGGSRRWSHTRLYENCGNVLVDEQNFQRFNQHIWFKQHDFGPNSYEAYRVERFQNGKRLYIIMAREVLGLPSGPGCKGDKADHINHETRDNRRDNLRVADNSQSNANRRTKSKYCRFKGITLNGLGFMAQFNYYGQHVYFPTLGLEAEAAIVYNYGADLVQGKFACVNVIPDEEMPTLERQWELYDMVISKLREKKILFDESRIMQR